MKLSKLDVERIENEVKKGEMVTQGEIVPVLLSKCDDYRATNLYLSLILSLATAIVGHTLELEMTLYVSSIFSAATIGYLLCFIPIVKRAFTGSDIISEEVHEKSMSMFIENNLHHTIDRNGILILVSLLEHRVQIVADKGINDRIEEGEWDKMVVELTAAIKSGQLIDGICATIRICSDLLGEHFPAKEDNPNELSNRLVTDLYNDSSE